MSLKDAVNSAQQKKHLSRNIGVKYPMAHKKWGEGIEIRIEEPVTKDYVRGSESHRRRPPTWDPKVVPGSAAAGMWEPKQDEGG